MGLFQNLVFFAIFLGVLVTVHEAGHFLAAKWAGVKVLKFSIGFGPKVLSFRRGETEYQIAALPLGGFVAMAGQIPGDDVAPEDAQRTFLGAPWWKRVIIALAGPAFNLAFPLFALFFINLGDVTHFSSRVGAVEPGSPAALAGIQPGDRIVDINGTPIRFFDELSTFIGGNAGKQLSITVERDGKNISLLVTPANVESLGVLEVTQQGRIGVALAEQAAVLGVPVDSPAAQAGLSTFDRVIAVDDKPVRTLRELSAALNRAATHATLLVVRFQELHEGVVAPQTLPVTVQLQDGQGLSRLGVEGGDAYIREVLPFTPAAALGLKPKDRLVAIDGRAVHSAAAVQDRLALARQRAVNLEWKSGSELHQNTVGPLAPQGNAKYCMIPVDFGVRFGASHIPMEPLVGETVVEHVGPWAALKGSLRDLPEGIRVTWTALSKLSMGDMPLEAMGGPLQIFQVASLSAEAGWRYFLDSMARVSVNLALVNLLPIPILDGFTILTAIWEAVRRRPIPLKAKEVATYFGFALLAMLMVVAFRNDIARMLFC